MTPRRRFLTGTAAMLAAPAIVQAQARRVLKFVPAADLSVLDPVWTTSYQSRDHGFLVFDTLFGLDAAFQPQPQMADGAVNDVFAGNQEAKLPKVALPLQEMATVTGLRNSPD